MFKGSARKVLLSSPLSWSIFTSSAGLVIRVQCLTFGLLSLFVGFFRMKGLGFQCALAAVRSCNEELLDMGELLVGELESTEWLALHGNEWGGSMQ